MDDSFSVNELIVSALPMLHVTWFWWEFWLNEATKCPQIHDDGFTEDREHPQVILWKWLNLTNLERKLRIKLIK